MVFWFLVILDFDYYLYTQEIPKLIGTFDLYYLDSKGSTS